MQAAGPGRSRRKPSLRCGLGMEPRGITASDHLRRFEVLEWQQHRKVPRLRPRALGEEEKRASQPLQPSPDDLLCQSRVWLALSEPGLECVSLCREPGNDAHLSSVATRLQSYHSYRTPPSPTAGLSRTYATPNCLARPASRSIERV